MTLEQIENLIAGMEFQKLKYFQEKSNLFAILGQTHTEHWHSSFLSWLLDPHSSLGLGHYPLVRLILLYMIKKADADISMQELFAMKLDEVQFQTEFTFYTPKRGKRSIDVYGESEELLFIIENKVKARENMNGTEIGQTQDYREYAEKNRKKGQKLICLFLTPDPKQKPYDTSYVRITYQELYDYVISKCIEHPQLNQDGRYLLVQYANNLREPVHGSPMALVNTELCKSIYAQHKEVLDTIFSEVKKSPDYTKDESLSCVIYRHYRSIFDEIYLSLEERHYGRVPNSSVRRKKVGFTELYEAHKIENGTEFQMEYNGVLFYAVAEYDAADRECYLVLLDEEKKHYHNKNGEVVGYYMAPSQAGIDAINLYRKRHQIDGRIESLNGTVYWKTKDGRTIKELIDSL